MMNQCCTTSTSNDFDTYTTNGGDYLTTATGCGINSSNGTNIGYSGTNMMRYRVVAGRRMFTTRAFKRRRLETSIRPPTNRESPPIARDTSRERIEPRELEQLPWRGAERDG